MTDWALFVLIAYLLWITLLCAGWLAWQGVKRIFGRRESWLTPLQGFAATWLAMLTGIITAYWLGTEAVDWVRRRW